MGTTISEFGLNRPLKLQDAKTNVLLMDAAQMPAIAYQIVFLGQQSLIEQRFKTEILKQFADLGIGSDCISFFAHATFSDINRKLPTLAVYLGAENGPSHDAELKILIDDSTVIIPVVSDLNRAEHQLPSLLRHINALEIPGPSLDISRLVSLTLEMFRLLRKERRLFISYRRVDSQSMANQLYDELDRRGFDVFIDVRSVPPGIDFQSELWHRMSDSDLLILIDTPGFMSSRWTTEELAQANLTNIQILHLLWPGQHEDPSTSFSHYFSLTIDDFENSLASSSGKLNDACLNRVCQNAELLRARAMSARHRYLVDNFCDTARDMCLPVAVQPERWISLKVGSTEHIAVVPAVGVPTSDRIHMIHKSISSHVDGPFSKIWVLYDNRGVLSTWLDHLSWLNGFLPISAIQMSKTQYVLTELNAC